MFTVPSIYNTPSDKASVNIIFRLEPLSFFALVQCRAQSWTLYRILFPTDIKNNLTLYVMQCLYSRRSDDFSVAARLSQITVLILKFSNLSELKSGEMLCAWVEGIYRKEPSNDDLKWNDREWVCQNLFCYYSFDIFCIKSSNERDKKGWEMGAENLKMGEIP